MNDSGSNVADNLPAELLWEILTRLTCIKSGLKCKAVSKSWLSVISSPHFMGSLLRKHVYSTNPTAPPPPPPPFALIARPNLAGTSKGQLLYPNNIKFGFSACFLPNLLSTITSDQGPPIKVLATCNDLILCGKDDREQSDHMYIFNPLTIKWITLPTPPRSYSRFFTGFACDPYYCKEDKQVVGYSVVVVNCDGGHGDTKNLNQFEAQVFSSLIGQWREVILWLPKPFKTSFQCRSLFYHGMLYFYDLLIGMIAFDPIISNNEKQKGDGVLGIGCHFIDWPLDFLKSCWNTRTTACLCQGNLRLVQKNGTSLSVWDLKNHATSEWQIKYKIVLTDLVSQDSSLHYLSDRITPFTLLGFQPFDNVTLYLCMCNRIVTCDLKTMRLQCIFTIPDESKTFGPSRKSFGLFRPFWLMLQPQLL